MEKKSPLPLLIFVRYYEDMKACKLFDPISKDSLFIRVFNFDEHFDVINSPNHPIDCLVEDGGYCVDIFVFAKQEVDGITIFTNHTIGNGNEQVENLHEVAGQVEENIP